MARNDWVALVTGPAAEYTAYTELARFGLTPYLPQACRRWSCASVSLSRRYPLFPRYLLLPITQANLTTIRMARGVRKVRPLVAAESGSMWRAPNDAILQLQAAEQRGDFDEVMPKGTPVRISGTSALAGIDATLERAGVDVIELFSPLLGGARIKVAAARVVRV